MPGVLPKAAAPAQTAARKYGYRGMMRGDGPGAKNGIQKNRLQRAAPGEKRLFQGLIMKLPVLRTFAISVKKMELWRKYKSCIFAITFKKRQLWRNFFIQIFL
jgi:hypothetical protein